MDADAAGPTSRLPGRLVRPTPSVRTLRIQVVARCSLVSAVAGCAPPAWQEGDPAPAEAEPDDDGSPAADDDAWPLDDDTTASEPADDDTTPPETVPGLLAGFRASPYGITPFPDPEYWQGVADAMAGRFEAAAPAGVWIVGVAGADGVCYLSFPSPHGSHEDVGFAETDQNEAALDWFDEHGVRVWLQVEPADAGVVDLIDLVLARYGHHPSVVGFGVDVEWYRFLDHEGGKAVDDDKARRWRDAVAAHDRSYALFLKHWLADRMPPTEREGLLFVDDGQGFSSLAELEHSFSVWGETFAPAPVAYQYGYDSDRPWWSDLGDPPGEVGQAILDAVPNTAGLYWVDFTVEEAFPP